MADLHKVILLLLVYLIAIDGQNVAAQSGNWRLKNRLQTTYEFDSNIRETPSDIADNLEDSSLRLLFHSRATRSWKTTRLFLAYQGGLQTYLHHPVENKLINELNFVGTKKAGPLTVGIRGEGRLKIFVNDTLDYAAGSGEIFIGLPPFLKLRNEIGVTFSVFNYKNFSAFSYSENQLRWSLSRKLFARFSSGFEIAVSDRDYDRNVLETSSVNPNSFFEVELEERNYRFGLKLNYTRSFLINLNYTLQRNDATSTAFDYFRHQLVLIFGVPLSSGLWLRGYGAIQFKKYDEDAEPPVLTDIDTERDQSNFFIVDLSKDLRTGITAILRFALYNNESIIRNRFYRKTLVTVGFDFHL